MWTASSSQNPDDSRDISNAERIDHAMAEAESETLKILIADDEDNIRRILTTRLAMQGHEVVEAANGVEALELFRTQEPELVVLDVMMPELDGFAV
jgi:CheY-like chemotaxis protein